MSTRPMGRLGDAWPEAPPDTKTLSRKEIRKGLKVLEQGTGFSVKEVAGKKMASPNPLEPTMEEEAEPPAATEGLNLGGLRAVAHLRKQQEARKRSNAAADEEGADGDDGD